MRKFYLLFLMTLFSLFAGAEDWVSLGYVKFTEGALTYRNNNALTQQDFIVELQQDQDTPTLYRLVNPYKDMKGTRDGDDYDGSSTHYMVIDAHDPYHVYFEPFETGYIGRDGLYSMQSTLYYFWQFDETSRSYTYDDWVKDHGSSYTPGTYDESTNTITFPGAYTDSQGVLLGTSIKYIGTTGRTDWYYHNPGYADTVIHLTPIDEEAPEVPAFSFYPESGTTLEDGELSTVTLTCDAGINLTEYGTLEFPITKDGNSTDYTLYGCPGFNEHEGDEGAYTSLTFVVKYESETTTITDPGEYVITIDVGAITFTNGTTNDKEITLTYIIEEEEEEPTPSEPVGGDGTDVLTPNLTDWGSSTSLQYWSYDAPSGARYRMRGRLDSAGDFYFQPQSISYQFWTAVSAGYVRKVTIVGGSESPGGELGVYVSHSSYPDSNSTPAAPSNYGDTLIRSDHIVAGETYEYEITEDYEYFRIINPQVAGSNITVASITVEWDDGTTETIDYSLTFDPDGTEVLEKLSTVSISCEAGIGLGEYSELTYDITKNGSATNYTIYCCPLFETGCVGEDGNYTTLVFQVKENGEDSSITTTGEYTITIPVGKLTFADGTTNTEAYSITYTIEGDEDTGGTTGALPEGYSVDPPEGEVDELSTITITGEDGNLIYRQIISGSTTVTDASGAEIATITWSPDPTYSGAYVTGELSHYITDEGTYYVNIPDGQLTKDVDSTDTDSEGNEVSNSLGAITLTYYVNGTVEEDSKFVALELDVEYTIESNSTHGYYKWTAEADGYLTLAYGSQQPSVYLDEDCSVSAGFTASYVNGSWQLQGEVTEGTTYYIDFYSSINAPCSFTASFTSELEVEPTYVTLTTDPENGAYETSLSEIVLTAEGYSDLAWNDEVEVSDVTVTDSDTETTLTTGASYEVSSDGATVTITLADELTEQATVTITIPAKAIVFTDEENTYSEETTIAVTIQPEDAEIVVGSIIYDENGVAYEYTGTDAETGINCASIYRQSDTGVNGVTEGDVVISDTFTYKDVTYTVTGIVYDAFYQSNVTSITLPGTITTWADTVDGHNGSEGYSINDCSKLTSVTFSEGITSIGKYIIYFSSGSVTNVLKTISLPSTLKTIAQAFNRCQACEELYVYAETPPSLAEGVTYIYNGTFSPTVYVPCGTNDAYAASDAFGSFTIANYDDCADETITFEPITDNETISLEAGAEGYYSYTAEADGTLTFSESGVTVYCYSDEEMTQQITPTSEDGEVYSIAVTAGSTYYFHLVAGDDPDPITFTFAKEAEEPEGATMVVSPYDGEEVYELSEIIVSCEDGLVWNAGMYFQVFDKDNNVVAGVWGAKAKEMDGDDKVLSYSLPLEDDDASGEVYITLDTPGEYKFTIPAGSFFFAGDHTNLNEETTITFTIVAAIEPEPAEYTITFDPENGGTLTLKSDDSDNWREFSIICEDGIAFSDAGSNHTWTLRDVEDGVSVSLKSFGPNKEGTAIVGDITSAITTAGTYYLGYTSKGTFYPTIPEGTFLLGPTGSQVESEEMEYYFTVEFEDAVEPDYTLTFDPDGTQELTSLSSVTISCEGGIAAKEYSTEYEWPILLDNAETGYTLWAMPGMSETVGEDGNYTSITFVVKYDGNDAKLVAAGTYTISGELTLTNDETVEVNLTYTIDGSEESAEPTTPTLTYEPDLSDELSNLSTITITSDVNFSFEETQTITLNITLSDGDDTDYTLVASVDENTTSSITFTVMNGNDAETIVKAGYYTITIPAGTFTFANGYEMADTYVTFTIDGTEAPEETDVAITISPSGETEAFDTITISAEGHTDVDWNWDDEDYSKVIVVNNNTQETVAYGTAESDNNDYVTCTEVYITLNTTVSAPGEYTIIVPANSLYFTDDYSTNAEGTSVVTILGTEEPTEAITLTIVPADGAEVESISEIVITAEDRTDLEWNDEVEVSTVVVYGSDGTPVAYGADISDDYNEDEDTCTTITVALSTEITAEGNYTISIPESAIYFANDGTPAYSEAANVSVYIPLSYTFTPAVGEATDISEITITFNAPIALSSEITANNCYVTSNSTSETVATVTSAELSSDGLTLTITLSSTPTEAGIYVFHMAAGFTYGSNKSVSEITANYVIADSSFESDVPEGYYVVPEDGSIQESISEIRVYADDEKQMYREVSVSAVTYVYNESGTAVTTVDWGSPDYTNKCAVGTLALTITDPGTYTISVPEGKLSHYKTSTSTDPLPAFDIVYTIAGNEEGQGQIEWTEVTLEEIYTIEDVSTTGYYHYTATGEGKYIIHYSGLEYPKFYSDENMINERTDYTQTETVEGHIGLALDVTEGDDIYVVISSNEYNGGNLYFTFEETVEYNVSLTLLLPASSSVEVPNLYDYEVAVKVEGYEAEGYMSFDIINTTDNTDYEQGYFTYIADAEAAAAYEEAYFEEYSETITISCTDYPFYYWRGEPKGDAKYPTLVEGNNYSFNVTFRESQSAWSTTFVKDETLFTIIGSGIEYVYSDYEFSSISPAPSDDEETVDITSVEQNTFTITFTGPVRIVEEDSFVNFGTNGGEIAFASITAVGSATVEDGYTYCNSWKLVVSEEVMSMLSGDYEGEDLPLVIAAEDAEGRRVQGNGSGEYLEELTFLNFTYSTDITDGATSSSYTITTTPADGATVGHIDTITFACEDNIDLNNEPLASTVTIINEDGDTVAVGAEWSDNGTYEEGDTGWTYPTEVYLTIDATIVAEGQYTIHVPASTFVLGEDGIESKEIEISVYVDGSEEDEEYTPAAGDVIVYNKVAYTVNEDVTTVTIAKQSSYSEYEGVDASGEITFPVSFDYKDNTFAVTAMVNGAYQANTNITAVNIEAEITEISNVAFYQCTSLATVTLPSTLTTIDGNAFNLCKSISSMTCYAENPPTLVSNTAMQNATTTDAVLHVPCEYIANYTTDEELTTQHLAYYFSVVTGIDGDCSETVDYTLTFKPENGETVTITEGEEITSFTISCEDGIAVSNLTNTYRFYDTENSQGSSIMSIKSDEEDENTVIVTLQNAITAAGTYKVQYRSGGWVDGFIAGQFLLGVDATPSEAIEYSFTVVVEEAVEPDYTVTFDPDGTQELTSLSSVTISCEGGIKSIAENDGWAITTADGTETGYILYFMNGISADPTVDADGNILSFTATVKDADSYLDVTLTEAGTYTITIPINTFTFADESTNEETITITYVVDGSEVPAATEPELSYNPATGTSNELDSLDKVVITCVDGTFVFSEATELSFNITDYGSDTGYVLYASVEAGEYNELTLTVMKDGAEATLTQEGTYDILIPASTFSYGNGTTQESEINLEYYITGNLYESEGVAITISPSGETEAFDTITITAEGHTDVDWNWDDEDFSKVIVVDNSTGDTVAYGIDEDDNNNYVTCTEVYITLSKKVSAPGEYTIIVPANSLYFTDDYSTNAEGTSVVTILEAEPDYTLTFDPDGTQDLTSLSSVTISCEGGIKSIAENDGWAITTADGTETGYILYFMNGISADPTTDDDGNIISFTATVKDADYIDATITEAGEYVITIPVNTFTFADESTNEEAITITYVVDGSEVPAATEPELSYNPATGTSNELDSLDKVVITCVDGTFVFSEDTELSFAITDYGQETDYVLYASVEAGEYSELTLTVMKDGAEATLTQEGTYDILIPASTFSYGNGTTQESEINLEYYITGNLYESEGVAITISPSGETEAFDTITITAEGHTDVDWNWDDEDFSKVIVVDNSTGDTVAYGIDEDDNNNYVTCTEVYITLNEKVSAPGEYTIIVPANSLYFTDDYSTNAEGTSVVTIPEATETPLTTDPAEGDSVESLPYIDVWNPDGILEMDWDDSPYDETDIVVYKDGVQVGACYDYGFDELYDNATEEHYGYRIYFKDDATSTAKYEFIEAGEYKVSFPGQFFMTATDAGVNTYVDAFEVSFTVTGKAVTPDYTLTFDPTGEDAVGHIEEVTISSEAGIDATTAADLSFAITMGDAETGYYLTFSTGEESGDGVYSSITLVVTDADGNNVTIVEEGEYTVTIPEGAITYADGTTNTEEITVTYSVDGSESSTGGDTGSYTGDVITPDMTEWEVGNNNLQTWVWTGPSGAEYHLRSRLDTYGDFYIQTNSKSYQLWTEKSGGYIRKVTVVGGTNSNAGTGTLSLYAQHNSYSTSSSYPSEPSSLGDTLIESYEIKSGETYEFYITDNYEYFRLYGTSGAYCTASLIAAEWETPYEAAAGDIVHDGQGVAYKVQDDLESVYIAKQTADDGSYEGQTEGALVIYETIEAVEDGKTYSVTGAETSAFKDASITSIELPGTLAKFGSGSTFNGCTSLASVTLNEGITCIAGSMFSGCTALTEINVPEGVTYVDSYAFNGCTSLTTIYLPSTIRAGEYDDETIGGSAFAGCSKLAEFTILAENPPYVGNKAFDSSIISNATLYVPCDYVDAYANYSGEYTGWESFGAIVGLNCPELDYTLTFDPSGETGIGHLSEVKVTTADVALDADAAADLKWAILDAETGNETGYYLSFVSGVTDSEGNYSSITLAVTDADGNATQITEAGEYTVTILAGDITYADGTTNAEDITLTYTVNGSEWRDTDTYEALCADLTALLEKLEAAYAEAKELETEDTVEDLYDTIKSEIEELQATLDADYEAGNTLSTDEYNEKIEVIEAEIDHLSAVAYSEYIYYQYASDISEVWGMVGDYMDYYLAEMGDDVYNEFIDDFTTLFDNIDSWRSGLISDAANGELTDDDKADIEKQLAEYQEAADLLVNKAESYTYYTETTATITDLAGTLDTTWAEIQETYPDAVDLLTSEKDEIAAAITDLQTSLTTSYEAGTLNDEDAQATIDAEIAAIEEAIDNLLNKAHNYEVYVEEEAAADDTSDMLEDTWSEIADLYPDAIDEFEEDYNAIVSAIQALKDQIESDYNDGSILSMEETYAEEIAEIEEMINSLLTRAHLYQVYVDDEAEADSTADLLDSTWEEIRDTYGDGAIGALQEDYNEIVSSIDDLKTEIENYYNDGTILDKSDDIAAEIEAIKDAIDQLLENASKYGATGIYSIYSDYEGMDVYTLNGQKINAPTQRGIYIINGKKVYVK